MKKLKSLKVKGFTLVEMLVVLLIISVLMLLFVPNLTKQKEAVTEKGNAAVVKVVESQAELFEVNHTNEKATLSKLINEGTITDKQAASYKAYYAKHTKEARSVADSGIYAFGKFANIIYNEFLIACGVGLCSFFF